MSAREQSEGGFVGIIKGLIPNISAKNPQAEAPDIAEKTKIWIALSEQKMIHQERTELTARLKNHGLSHIARLEAERGHTAQQRTENFVNRMIDRLPKDDHGQTL